MKTIRRAVERTIDNEMVRYLFFGVCTTALNLGIFTILRYEAGWSVRGANLVSILAAVVFAFFVNKWLVFRAGGSAVLREFAGFAGMRLLTMAVEFFGVELLVNRIGAADFTGKLVIQVVVVICNYLISKFVVFREKQEA